MPGVHAVLTAADIPATAIIPNRVPAPAGTDRYLQPAIARDVVRYVGEPVALVVADDPYVAWDALERIDVVYEPLPVCPSVADALAPGAPRLFPGRIRTTSRPSPCASAMRTARWPGRPWSSASASPIRARPRPRWRRAGSWPSRPTRAAASCT